MYGRVGTAPAFVDSLVRKKYTFFHSSSRWIYGIPSVQG